MDTEKPKDIIYTKTTFKEPIKVEMVALEKKNMYAKIDLISVYERILDKGYQSVGLLKKVGNSRYFEGDLEMAAKWYTQLFALTTDLEVAYYYRYAQSLKSICQFEKSNEMMAVYEKTNLKK